MTTSFWRELRWQILPGVHCLNHFCFIRDLETRLQGGRHQHWPQGSLHLPWPVLHVCTVSSNQGKLQFISPAAPPPSHSGLKQCVFCDFDCGRAAQSHGGAAGAL